MSDTYEVGKASKLNIKGNSRWLAETNPEGDVTATVVVSDPVASDTQITQKVANVIKHWTFPEAFKFVIDNIAHLFSNKQNNIPSGDSAGHVILDTTAAGSIGKTTGTLAIAGGIDQTGTAKVTLATGNTALTHTLSAALTVGATSINTGGVTIRSAGTSATTITGPNNGEAVLSAGTMEVIGNKATVLTDITSDTKYTTVKAVVTGLNGKQATLSGPGFVKATDGVITYDNNTYLTSIPTATEAILGGVKVTTGNGLGNSSGTISMSSFTGASASGAGTSGAVKQPVAGDQVKFLKGDGNWTALALADLPTATGSFISDSTYKRKFLASTNTGTAGALTMQAISAADVPDLGAGKITSGTIAAERLPLGYTTVEADRNYKITSDTNGLYVNVPWTVYNHPTGDGNLHVPVTGAGNDGKFLKAGNTAGSLSWDTIPTASSTVTGGVKVSATAQTTGANSVTSNANRSYAVQLTSAGVAVVNVPWENTDSNTTYSAATGGGLSMSTGNAFSVATVAVGSGDVTGYTPLYLHKDTTGQLYVLLQVTGAGVSISTK
jgi:hypothetical protein